MDRILMVLGYQHEKGKVYYKGKVYRVPEEMPTDLAHDLTRTGRAVFVPSEAPQIAAEKPAEEKIPTEAPRKTPATDKRRKWGKRRDIG